MWVVYKKSATEEINFCFVREDFYTLETNPEDDSDLTGRLFHSIQDDLGSFLSFHVLKLDVFLDQSAECGSN